jgi:hypothetical protein
VESQKIIGEATMSVRRSRTVFRYHVAIGIMAILARVAVTDARAQITPPTQAAAPQPAPAEVAAQQTAAAKLPACNDKRPEVLPPGNLKLSVAVDPMTSWQPRGGEVKFTIKGTGFPANNMALIACFQWKGGATAEWYQSPSVRLIDNGVVAGTTSFSATVPPNLPGMWWQRMYVPRDDFRVMATSLAASAPDWSPLDVTLSVGITNRLFAFVITFAVVAIAFVCFYRFGRSRGVPGGKDVILTIISTKGGYASLSQLQIILWSFVIGAGAIYVMALAGNLIEISQGTLVLLGISGVATVASKLQSYSETQSAPTPPAPPGAVTRLTIADPRYETEVQLSWAAPASGGPPQTYTVQYRASAAQNAQPNPWITTSSTLRRPRFRVVDLTPDTCYDFQVFAVNAGGPGEPSVITSPTLPAQQEQRAAIADLHPSVVTNCEIGLVWSTVANTGVYHVQYRVHDSGDNWTDCKVNRAGATIKGLRANTLYDLRVAALYPPQAGLPILGAWRTVKAATTGPRIPKWSDLVIASDTQSEIDVTRVQMLFFTVIVALFVALRIVSSGEIPVIPEGYLLLMGISNGVYLTAKFVPG